MSLTTYTFPLSDLGGAATITGNAPFTIVFQPSAINLGKNIIGNISYSIFEQATQKTTVVTRNYSYSTLQDALTGSTQYTDSRGNFSHTFYNSASGETVNTVSICSIIPKSSSNTLYVNTCCIYTLVSS